MQIAPIQGVATAAAGVSGQPVDLTARSAPSSIAPVRAAAAGRAGDTNTGGRRLPLQLPWPRGAGVGQGWDAAGLPRHRHIELEGLATGGEGEFATARSLQASVDATWLRSVLAGASNRDEQALRIADAIYRAYESEVGGGNASRAITVAVEKIRGPVKPVPPRVWLPAEYPPPRDDAALRAQLAADGDRA